jgi:hypothetical protein
MILHTIRNIVDDSTLFFDILQTFYREHEAGSHVTTADFKEVVERKTGKNWDKFFEAYLYQREVPVLHWYFGIYKNDQEKGNSSGKELPFVVAKWTRVPEGFSMPVMLQCVDGDLKQRIEVTTKPTIFYLNEGMSCAKLSGNRRFSYFTSVIDTELLGEVEKQ